MKLTKIKIYGKDGCSFCKKAVNLSHYLQETQNVELEYINTTQNNIPKEEVAKQLGLSEIKTYPQIVLTIDGENKYIGGFTDFEAFVMENIEAID